MGGLAPNEALAIEVVERLWASGVRTFAICPGGRNAPLVETLERLPRSRTDLPTFFDERGAAFFALGRARRDGRPAAVCTTSGTAAAELLPAMIEAHYSGAPLVAVTADRPAAFRGTGAPQAIEQAGLFGVYARTAVDLTHAGASWRLDPDAGPTHVNVCFAEPLLDGWQHAVPRTDDDQGVRPAPAAGPVDDRSASDVGERVGAFLASARSPLVILGALRSEADRFAADGFCRAIGCPVLAEASSHLRATMGSLLLRTGDAAARRGLDQGLFDAVIRIGDVPSCRVWRDLDRMAHVPVLSVSRLEWSGLPHGVHLQVPPAERLPLPLDRAPSGGAAARASVAALLEWDAARWQGVERLFDRWPLSEPALVRRLSASIPNGAAVYLGNSLPIREWNQFAVLADRGHAIGESRGANGIDGQLSTFLGWARRGVENWAVVGDLTALYDLSSLWALPHLDGLTLRIVVINNGGGRIFERLFANPRFQNRHLVDLGAWAAMWRVDYHQGLPAGHLPPVTLIEIVPDDEQTAMFQAHLSEEMRA